MKTVKQIKEDMGVVLDTELAGIPRVKGKIGTEVFYLEPILDINRQ